MRGTWPLVVLAVAVALPVTLRGEPLLTKVDHVIVVGGDSERLFELFRKDPQLPVAWPFVRFGEFGSSGIAVGDVNLEFLWQRGRESRTARFAGIALTPQGGTSGAVAELDRRGIPHDDLEAYRPKEEGVLGIVISGRSTRRASAYLAGRHMLGSSGRRSVWIDSATGGGLTVEMTEE